MALNDRFRKIIVPNQGTNAPTSGTASIIRVDGRPDVGILIEDTLNIIQTEILKYKQRANSSITGTLSPTDAKTVQGYAKTLVDMAKEARTRSAEADAELSNLSDDELLKQTEAAAAAIRQRMRKPGPA